MYVWIVDAHGTIWVHTFLYLKDGLSLKIKNLDFHLYFIATKYLWNNALVEYIDN